MIYFLQIQNINTLDTLIPFGSSLPTYEKFLELTINFNWPDNFKSSFDDAIASLIKMGKSEWPYVSFKLVDGRWLAFQGLQ